MNKTILFGLTAMILIFSIGGIVIILPVYADPPCRMLEHPCHTVPTHSNGNNNRESGNGTTTNPHSVAVGHCTPDCGSLSTYRNSAHATESISGTAKSGNGTTNATAPTTIPTTPAKIPNWVKGIFSYYAQGKLSDADLISSLQFLIQQGIIKVS